MSKHHDNFSATCLDRLKALPEHLPSAEMSNRFFTDNSPYDDMNALLDRLHQLEREHVWWTIEAFVANENLGELKFSINDEASTFRVCAMATEKDGEEWPDLSELDDLETSINSLMDVRMEVFMGSLLEKSITQENLAALALEHVGEAFVQHRRAYEEAKALEAALPEDASRPSKKPRV